ncbi:M1 family aminopeptidase [Congregibacter variabilis]|uniref:Aminopeptidase N n=1 Tax=Congregibacter variabilis TaxID=3081200 RepID=A0ABZ0I205_9GAMM|nr:M1 family aminopeptidase [Congregibacter sp. IMCC43200]
MQAEPGVSAALALERADRISALTYDLQLWVPEDASKSVEGRMVMRFALASAAAPLQIDFAQQAEDVVSVSAQNKSVSYQFSNEHIIVPVSALKPGENEISIIFRATQDAINRNPDFLFTLFVPDRARRAFPVLDQPDLKARYTLSLDTPATWVAMSNGPVQSDEVTDDRRVFRFAETDPIPSYLFSFVAGQFETVEREFRGRQMSLLHRETDKEKFARNIDAIFEAHADALDWLEDYTGIAYPFEKFGFALIPDFPYGGMEHVGAIQYRASSLLLEESPSQNQLLNRAQLIAHETAHMWFGNLVTMRWFDDVWTKEVFANFMADKIVNPQFPDTDHALNFLISHYPQAYGVDRSEGANPIRQQLDNLNLAGQMYGPIIYHKAPIMMRQLELLLGEQAFRDGLQSYLSRYAYANATWPALIEILDEKTDIDLASWSEVWVNTAGMPNFVLTQGPQDDGDDPQWALKQLDPAGASRQWPQQFSLLNLERDDEVDMLAAGEVHLPAELQSKPLQAVLFNANGLGYGRFPADLSLFNSWDSLSAVQRGVLLVSSFENLISPPYGSATQYFDILRPIVESESNELLIELAANQLHYVYFSLLNAQERSMRTASLETGLWETMLMQDSPSMTKLYFELFSGLALSDLALTRLHAIWTGEQSVEQLSLQEAEKIRLAEILAVRLPDRADSIIAKQRAQTENPDRRRRLDFISPALVKDPAVRDAFFESLKNPENRATEVWVSGALRRLNDPTRLDQAFAYLLPSLELLEDIQITGDIFFPSAWLNGALSAHTSLDAADTVRRFLKDRPNYNPQLEMKILQAADPLFRASALQSSSN